MGRLIFLPAARGVGARFRYWGLRACAAAAAHRGKLAGVARFAAAYILAPFVIAWSWIQIVSPTLWSVLEAAASRPDRGAGVFTAAGCTYIALWSSLRAVRRRRPQVVAQPWAELARPARPADGPGLEADASRRRARHEAAHAVAATAMGATVLWVDIQFSGTRGGQCAIDLPASMPVVDSLWAQMVCSLSGNAIDLAAGHHDQGAQSDVHDAMQLAAGIISAGRCPAGYDGPLTFDGLLSGARERAGMILALNDRHLESIAARLQDRPGTRLAGPADLPELDRIHRGVPTLVRGEALIPGPAPHA